MASPNAPVLTEDPLASLFDEGTLSSLLLKSLGATNPTIAQSALDTAFGAGVVPTGPTGGQSFQGTTLRPADILALRQQAFQQAVQERFAAPQRAAAAELRGVGAGPAAEQQRAEESSLAAITKQFRRAGILIPISQRRRGGGIRRDDPSLFPPTGPPPTDLTRFGVEDITKFGGKPLPRDLVPPPEPARIPPPAIQRLQQALEAARTTERELGRRQVRTDEQRQLLGASTLAGADPTAQAVEFQAQQARAAAAGASFTLAQIMGRPATPFASEQQAFTETLAQRDPRSLAAMNDQQVGEVTIRAWHQGNAQLVKEGFKILGERRSAIGRTRGRATTRRALARREEQLFERAAARFDIRGLFGITGDTFGLSDVQIMKAFMSPRDIQELLTEIERGRDPQDIANEIRGRQQLREFQRQETAASVAPTQGQQPAGGGGQQIDLSQLLQILQLPPQDGGGQPFGSTPGFTSTFGPGGLFGQVDQGAA